jgi:hypothetical protein
MLATLLAAPSYQAGRRRLDVSVSSIPPVATLAIVPAKPIASAGRFRRADL